MRGDSGLDEGWYLVKVDGPTNDVSLTICDIDSFGFVRSLVFSGDRARLFGNVLFRFTICLSCPGKER